MHTVYLLQPMSDDARQWIDENVAYESYQQLGTGVVVEHRYIGPIVEAMMCDGLEQEIDFRVIV